MTLQETLALISIALTALKATGKVDPVVMGYITTADDAITEALAAVGLAKTNVDPTLLKPITPIT